MAEFSSSSPATHSSPRKLKTGLIQTGTKCQSQALPGTPLRALTNPVKSCARPGTRGCRLETASIGRSWQHLRPPTGTGVRSRHLPASRQTHRVLGRQLTQGPLGQRTGTEALAGRKRASPCASRARRVTNWFACCSADGFPIPPSICTTVHF
jgi:hypothetical protein